MEDDDQDAQPNHVCGTCTFVFISILILITLTSVLSIDRPASAANRTTSDENGCGVQTFFSNFFGVFGIAWELCTSITDVVLSPLSSLLRRDAALRELSQNY